MSISTFCVNTSCWCTVRDTGDACCAECEMDAESSMAAAACGCGHSECEPTGLQLEGELREEIAAPV